MDRGSAGWLLGGLAAAVLVPAVMHVRHVAAKDHAPVADLVDRLDYVFQERFRSTEGNLFGLSRIPVTPEHRQVVHWKPDQEMEKRVAQDLARQGLSGAFILAKPTGTYIAGTVEQVKKLTDAPPTGRGSVSRPILLSAGTAPQPLPTLGDVLKGAQGSVAAFQKRDRHEFKAGAWRIESRPIRAGAECLDCHRRMTGDKNLAQGALLGIAMYAFTPAERPAAPAP